MLDDAGAPVLVTQAALLDRLPVHGARVVRLDADWRRRSRGSPPTAPASCLAPHHPAYVIYTSGSTGTPKGVVVDSRWLCQQLVASRQDFVGSDRRRSAAGAAHLERFDASI